MIVDHKVSILCQKDFLCRINGPSKHVKVVSSSARVILQGFIFEGATDVAVHITSSAREFQLICKCHFIE